MEFLIIFLLFLLNGFFSMSELALVSAKSSRLETMQNAKKNGVQYALKLRNNPDQFLSAIQVGITLISFITGFYGGNSVAKYIAPLFELFIASPEVAYNITVTLSIFLITFFAIVIGELVPKNIGLANPEKIAAKVAPTIYYFSKIFYPLVKLLSVTTTMVNKVLGIHSIKSTMTEAELKHIIKSASETGVIEEEQNEFHENLFYFSDKKAKHIMTHRSEVEWIDINLSQDEFLNRILHSKNSKILVCRKELDDYMGVLKVKEFLTNKFLDQEISIEEMLDAPVVFPETVDAQDILDEFKAKQYYFCVILNEFGTIEGVVTLHDIMENIVGEIPEEEDVVEPDIFKREDNTFLVNGDAQIEVLADVIEGMDIDFEEIDYSTVAGFVLENIEKLPEVGDTFEFMNYKIEIVDVDHHRIDKILLTPLS